MLTFDSPSRASEVVRYIEKQIDEQGLVPGDRIGTKDQLREQAGVARATINEAVKLLHERGRIWMRSGPHGGLFVAEANPSVQLGRFLLAVGNDGKSVADAMALRDFLETMVLTEATAYRTAQDIADLRGCAAKLEQSLGDTWLVVEAIWELHLRIAQISPNVMLRSTYTGLVHFIREHVTALPDDPRDRTPQYQAKRARLHSDLVDVVESGDLSRVNHAIQAHNEEGA